jgi:hypothetical protein
LIKLQNPPSPPSCAIGPWPIAPCTVLGQTPSTRLLARATSCWFRVNHLVDSSITSGFQCDPRISRLMSHLVRLIAVLPQVVIFALQLLSAVDPEHPCPGRPRFSGTAPAQEQQFIHHLLIPIQHPRSSQAPLHEATRSIWWTNGLLAPAICGVRPKQRQPV